MGEMRSSKRAPPFGVTVHQHTDCNIDTDLTTAWNSLPQSKAALRRIENHVEAVPGTTALLLSIMDPPKKKLSVSVRSRDETRGSSKFKERRRSSSKKRRSRSPLRNATQDSNVSQHNSMALREQLASYRETTPSSQHSSQLEAYMLQSMSGPLSASRHTSLSQPVEQEDLWDKWTDGHQDITRPTDRAKACHVNDPPTVDTLQTYTNQPSSDPAIEDISPEAQSTQSMDIEKSTSFLPPASDLMCRWESTPSTSPGSDSQRLENLRRHQPDDKLEKLKERIRRQVKHQEASEKEKILGHLEQPIMPKKSNRGSPTTKIRKVAAAPQAPTYKGFSKTEARTRTTHGNWLKKEDPTLNRDMRKDCSKPSAECSATRPQRERHRSVERETKPTRKIHKAASGQTAKTVITPASWREGLKLVNKVLGTAAKQASEKRPHLDDKLQQTVPHRQSNVDKGREANHHSPRSTDRTLRAFQGQSKRRSTSTSCPSSACQDKCPVPLGEDPLSADIQAILDDPRLASKASEKEERPRPRSGQSKGGQKGKARSLSQTRTPLSFWGTTVPTYGPPRGCRSANSSPHRPSSTNGAETQEKKRHYDSDKIRQYIFKQKEERKRRQAEEKKSLKEESEKRNQRLQELYRRQKEMAKNVVTPTEATATPWQKRYRQATYNLLAMDETHLGDTIQMQPSALLNQLRPMYQPSGESDKENKKMELPQSPSSSDRSLTDQLSPRLARVDLDVGVTSLLNSEPNPVIQSLSASSVDALGSTSYDPLLSHPLRFENTVTAGDIKPTIAETPAWSQSRRSRIDALKATAISLSNRIESEARQIARVGINLGEATSLDGDILAPMSTGADVDEGGLVLGPGTFENDDLTSRIQRLITTAGLSPYNNTSLPGIGNLHTFKEQAQQITANRTEHSPCSYGLERSQLNGLERIDDMLPIGSYGAVEDNIENRTDLHDSSGGSISEGTILSEGSFSKDEVSPPPLTNNQVSRLLDPPSDAAGQKMEVQRLTDFQKEAIKCLPLTSPLMPQNSNKMPWEELNKGDPFSVINIYLKNFNVKVNERNTSCSGDSHRNSEVYDDDFVSFHSSGVSHQSKNGSSPHSVATESKKSPPSRGRLASPSDYPDLALSQASASLKNDSRKNGKLQYSPTALQQYMAAELKYQESIDESLRQLGDVERLLGLPVAPEAKQQKSSPSRARTTSPSGFLDLPAVDFCSDPPRNSFSVGPSNSKRDTGDLQYSPAALHLHLTTELQYQESIDESMRQLGDVERMMGVSMSQQENPSLAQMLKASQQQYENDLYEQKIQAERKALEAQLQREEDRQRIARAHEELLEKLVLTQKETAEAARHIKELTDLARTQIEGALAVPVAAPDSLILTKHHQEKQGKSDSDSFQRDESSRSFSHTGSRPLQRPNLIGAGDSCPNSPSQPSTEQIQGMNKEETELIWKKDDKQAEREAVSNSIEEECRTEDNDSFCSESIPSVADDKDYSFKFDSSKTEDEVEERSFSSLLPSKVHRRSSLENSPRHHKDSEEEAPDDSTTLVSGSHHVTKHQNPNMSFSGGKDSFSRFTMDMVRQHMKDEDLRLQHQNALLRLRQKAVKEKIRTELAWLEHQKKQLRNKGEDDKLPPIRKKQKGLLLRLQEEQAEIKRLQEANKVARKEKLLLLKQQEEIERMRSSTQRLKERLKSAGCEAPTESPVSETPVSEAAPSNIRPTDDSRTPSPSPSISASETGSIMQKLKKMRSHMDEKFLTKREQQLMQRRHHAEELLQWKKRLDQEEAEVRRIEKEALASWGESCVKSERRSKAILEIIPKSGHHRNSEAKAKSEKEYVTEDDYSSATSECSIHTEGHFQEPRGPSSAQPASEAEITLASNLSSPTNYIEDFASLTRSKQSSPIKGSHNRASSSDISSVSKMRLHSFQISKQSPKSPTETPSQAEPISEQSDIESRIKALKEELRKRKSMASQLKREQKMRHKERLKAQEASLLKQLKNYDNYIGKTKAELNKEPEPTPPSKSQRKDSTLVVKQADLTSPVKRSETNEMPTVWLSSDLSLHQDHTKSTSASEELNVEAVTPSPVQGSPDFLTSGQERYQSPDSTLRPSTEDAQSQIIESQKDNTMLESHSATADLSAHATDKLPSVEQSCRLDLDVISSVKEAMITNVRASSPPTDYQHDFESAVPSSSRKEQQISKPDSICHTETKLTSQDEEIEEEIADDWSHCSVTSGTSHKSGQLLGFQQTEESDHDSQSIKSTSPAPASHSHTPLALTQDKMPSFNIGDRVLVGNVQPGTLRFKGSTSFAEGFWAGVELDKSEGSNCGTYNGVVYFECPERHGIFAPPEKITHLSDNFEIFTDAAGHDKLYSDDASDLSEEDERKRDKNISDKMQILEKSNQDLSEKMQILEKSKETSCHDVIEELMSSPEQTLNSQQQPIAEIHLDSQQHNQCIPQNDQEINIPQKENVLDQYLPPSSQEIDIVEKDDSLYQSTSRNSQEISAITENDDLLDQDMPPASQEISAVAEKKEIDNQLIFSEVSHGAGDHKDEPKDQISPDTLADKLISSFMIDTVQYLVNLKRAKEQKIEASNQINRGIVFESGGQGILSLLEPHDGSFLPEDEPSSPEFCNRPESPILGASGQEELVKRLAELELNRDLLDEFGDDQDWFDEDFGLSSRREQQRLQQNQRDKETRLGASVGRLALSSEDPLRGLTSHPDGDLSAKTPPRPALPLPLPLKLPEEPVMVVPHAASEVEQMVHAAVQEIWESCGLTKDGCVFLSHMACPKPSQEFLGVEDSTEDQEALSIRSYKQAVYDLTWEILQEIYVEDPNANQPEWVKPQRVRSTSCHRIKTPGDINNVQEFVTEEVLKLYGLVQNKSKKSDWQRMLKFGRKKRDRVDQILVQELHEEEAQWVCYEEDELSVKMQLADSIFDLLLKDTANSLSLITKKVAVT